MFFEDPDPDLRTEQTRRAVHVRGRALRRRRRLAAGSGAGVLAAVAAALVLVLPGQDGTSTLVPAAPTPSATGPAASTPPPSSPPPTPAAPPTAPTAAPAPGAAPAPTTAPAAPSARTPTASRSPATPGSPVTPGSQLTPGSTGRTSAPPRTTAPVASPTFPPELRRSDPGQVVYGVYLAVARGVATDDPALAEAVRQAVAVGYSAMPGDVGCDDGAAKGLGLAPDQTYTGVALYFATRAQAAQFVAAYRPGVVGTAAVVLGCND